MTKKSKPDETVLAEVGLSTEKLIAFDREDAILAHRRDTESNAQLFSSVIDFSKVAIQSAILILGGSVVAGISFAGSVYSVDQLLAKSIISAVIYFAAGVFLSGCASGFAYVTQGVYYRAAVTKKYSFTHPYVFDLPKAASIRSKGIFWHLLSVGCIVTSYCCLIVGVWLIWDAVTNSDKYALIPAFKMATGI